MKILKAKVHNFGSYKSLEFDFHDLGLSLIYGATGSGKSTLQDIIPWIVFGITAKDGNVDEIRNWKVLDEATLGNLRIELSDGVIIDITRIRGTTKENDLYWENPGEAVQHRGKDLSDTQKNINNIIGMDYEAYMTAAAFNEFSESGLFFLAKAKDKRAVFEKVANLSFPTLLTEKITLNKKSTKQKLEAAEKYIANLHGRVEQLRESLDSTNRHSCTWEKAKMDAISLLQSKYDNFEKIKKSTVEALETKSYRFEEEKNKKIDDLIDKLEQNEAKDPAPLEAKARAIKDALSPHCTACGRANNTSTALEKAKADIEANNKKIAKFSELSERLRELQSTENPHKDRLLEAKKAKNHYGEQLENKKSDLNPFMIQIHNIGENVTKQEAHIADTTEGCAALKQKHSALERLQELSLDLRGVLLQTAVEQIQDKTNEYLDKYFDSEFKVRFELAQADSLEVSIYKNGYECVYKQLSKGQRQLLKLCFSVAIMTAAANNSGVSLNVLTFDEALSGLDSTLKSKAYGLFESLAASHPTVLVVEHDSEFQNLFTNKYKVELVSDESAITSE